MKIGKKEVINFSVPYIIAELGANHNGDMEIARKLIDAAKAAGCDCVKFQSWTKESLFSKKVYAMDNAHLRAGSKNEPSLQELLDRYSISSAELRGMSEYCRKVGIDFSCSPFSKAEADFLVDELKVPFIKVASMDLNNITFLEYVASKKRPIVLSTGLGTLAEIERAVRTIEKVGNRELVLLHCVSIYPLPEERVNLNNIDMLRQKFPQYPIGFSDHTLGVEIALAAVAKGACVIEKHFTLDRNMEGWDHLVSATPDEMKAIVDGARRVTKALGSFERVVSEDEKKNIPNYRRSVVAARRIESGQVIRAEDLDAKRPGNGLAPEEMPRIVGRRAKRTVEADEAIQLEDF